MNAQEEKELFKHINLYARKLAKHIIRMDGEFHSHVLTLSRVGGTLKLNMHDQDFTGLDEDGARRVFTEAGRRARAESDDVVFVAIVDKETILWEIVSIAGTYADGSTVASFFRTDEIQEIADGVIDPHINTSPGDGIVPGSVADVVSSFFSGMNGENTEGGAGHPDGTLVSRSKLELLARSIADVTIEAVNDGVQPHPTLIAVAAMRIGDGIVANIADGETIPIPLTPEQIESHELRVLRALEFGRECAKKGEHLLASAIVSEMWMTVSSDHEPSKRSREEVIAVSVTSIDKQTCTMIMDIEREDGVKHDPDIGDQQKVAPIVSLKLRDTVLRGSGTPMIDMDVIPIQDYVLVGFSAEFLSMRPN